MTMSSRKFVLPTAMALWPVVNCAGIFSRQIQCDAGSEARAKCRQVLAGVVTLNSDEAFEFETFSVNTLNHSEHGLFSEDEDVTVNLKIQKSPLLIAYDLQYEKDVVGGLGEETFEYSWSAAGGSSVFDGPDFDSHKCSSSKTVEDLTKSLGEDCDISDGQKQILTGGRVCGCQDTGWGSGAYTDVKRSELNCNAWPAVFRPSSTTWASRHCPRLVGPAYTVYTVLNWRWDFQVKVTLEWISGTPRAPALKREYFLTYNSPEAYDEDFDFKFKMVFSVPQSGGAPSDLGSRAYLLVPKKTPVSEIDAEELFNQNTSNVLHTMSEQFPKFILKLNSLRSESLLVPRDLVDLSGNSCDKIGVSLFSWANEIDTHSWVGTSQFCAGHPGQCMRNQPNDLLQRDKDLLKDRKTPRYLLEHKTLDYWSSYPPLMLSDSVANLLDHRSSEKGDPDLVRPTSIAWPTDVGHSTTLELFLNSTEVASITSSAKGTISNIKTSNKDNSNLVQVACTVANEDAMPAKFSITAGPCIQANTMTNDTGLKAPNRLLLPNTSEIVDFKIAPVSRTIEPDVPETLTLDVFLPSALYKCSYVCDIKLWNARGEELETRQVQVDFLDKQQSLGTIELPENSARNISHHSISQAVESPLWENYLRGFSTGQTKGICACSVLNVWCIAANFVECTEWIRRLITLVGILILSGFIILLCGPYLLSFCCAVGKSSCRFTKRKLAAISTSTMSTAENTPVKVVAPHSPASLLQNYMADANISISPHRRQDNTRPHSRRARDKALLDQAALFRASLLNTKGKILWQELQRDLPTNATPRHILKGRKMSVLPEEDAEDEGTASGTSGTCESHFSTRKRSIQNPRPRPATSHRRALPTKMYSNGRLEPRQRGSEQQRRRSTDSDYYADEEKVSKKKIRPQSRLSNGRSRRRYGSSKHAFGVNGLIRSRLTSSTSSANVPTTANTARREHINTTSSS